MAIAFGLILALSSIPPSTAIEWNDFTNNLATDLAPLITLFGEQVTKQFLSESLSIWDNVIFAMAPLGILTAVVSAIRVCGNSSLRAFIGRAQESPGTAEVELLSCTSETTSELWHEGGIARVFGSPQILEVVKLQTEDEDYKGPGCTAGIELFDGACREGAWVAVKGTQLDLEKSRYHRPNLSLNIGIKRQPKRVTYIAAAFGTILQLGVLVYAGLTAYLYPTQFLLDETGKLIESYAFPFTLAGTLLLCLGMFLCAFIIEQSTQEVHYKKKDTSQMYWVQPGGQKIGDQVFGSFIGCSNDSKYIISKAGDRNKFNRILWVTVVVTILGFIVQFVGLRAMHSSVIMAQLGATLLMAIIRAGLRAQRGTEMRDLVAMEVNDGKDDRNIIQGHELDFLAMKLEDVDALFVSRKQAGKLSASENFQAGKGIRSLVARARLARLTSEGHGLSWKGLQVREIASQLQAAIENAMEILSSRLGDDLSKVRQLHWPIYIRGGLNDEAFYLRLRKEGLGWKSDCSELEAVIGLWAWSLLRSDCSDGGRSSDKRNIRMITAVPDFGINEAKIWYQAWIQRRLVLEQGNFDRTNTVYRMTEGRPLFGCQVSQDIGDRATAIPLFVFTQNSTLTMCAQDVFMSFLGAVLRNIDDIGGKTTVRSSFEQSAFLLENSRIEDMANCFENSGLGSREDAYMCIVPLLMRESKLPGMDDALAAVRNHVKSFIKNDNKFTEAETLLQWICSNSSISEAKKPYLELAELYRTAMRHQDQKVRTVGFNGVCQLLEQVSKGDRSSAMSKLAYQYGWIGLQIASEIGDSKSLERLKRCGAAEDEVPDYVEAKLWRWAQKNNTTVIRYLIGKKGYHVDEKGPDGRTPLSWAAQHGNVDVATLLLEKNADRNIRDTEGRTPLLFAARNGHSSLVRMLLHEDTASLNIGILGSPLILAAKNGHEECVRILLDEPGIKIDIRDDSGYTALDHARAGDYENIVELLIENKAVFNPSGVLGWANGRGYQKIVDLVIENGVEYEDVFREAALHGHHLIVASLIKKGKVNFDVYGDRSLLLAVDMGHREVAGLLIKEGVKCEGVLVLAARRGYTEVVELLAEVGAGITAYETSESEEALERAANAGHKRIVELLIGKGVSFQGVALQEAARTGRLEIVELLIEKGVNLKANGATALKKAARAGWDAIVELLIKNGVDLRGSLATAAEGGHQSIAKRLLDAGADINEDEGAVLFGAVQWGNLAMADFLIKNGADVNAKDGSALKWAEQRNKKMAELLSLNGARRTSI